MGGGLGRCAGGDCRRSRCCSARIGIFLPTLPPLRKSGGVGLLEAERPYGEVDLVGLASIGVKDASGLFGGVQCRFVANSCV